MCRSPAGNCRPNILLARISDEGGKLIVKTLLKTRAVPLLLALALATQVTAAEKSGPPASTIKVTRTTVLDLAVAGKSLVVVGERGVIGRSDDGGQTWQVRQAPTSRSLTAVTFVDDRIGVAVGHGGTILRTEDGGSTWAAVPVKEIGRDAVLGVTALKNGHLVAFGAFGMYLVSEDQG